MPHEMQETAQTSPRTRPASSYDRVARELGCSPRRAQKESQSVFRRCATYLRAWRALGQDERIAAALSEIEAATGPMNVPRYAQAAHDETVADSQEDTLEAAYRLAPSPDTARALIRASAAARLRMEQREQALKVEQVLP